MKEEKITPEKLAKYFDVAEKALKKVKLTEKGSIDWKKSGEDFLDMAERYFDDAHFFAKQGNIVTAFAALNYAHGWLDAGARLGLFDVDGDNVLFTVDEEWTKKKNEEDNMKCKNEKNS